MTDSTFFPPCEEDARTLRKVVDKLIEQLGRCQPQLDEYRAFAKKHRARGFILNRMLYVYAGIYSKRIRELNNCMCGTTVNKESALWREAIRIFVDAHLGIIRDDHGVTEPRFEGIQFWIADKPVVTSQKVAVIGDSVSRNARLPTVADLEQAALNTLRESTWKQIRELQVSAQTAGPYISSALLGASTMTKPWANVTFGANHINPEQIDARRRVDLPKQFESTLMSNIINATQTKTIEIKHVVRINGQDADKWSKSQLWALIAEQQDVVKTLEAIEPKPESLKTEIGKRKNGVKDLVDYLDSLEKPGNIVIDSVVD